MLILAVDTSTEICSVAILKDDKTLNEVSFKVKSGHSGTILTTIDKVIKESGAAKTDINLVATGLGPGSFTGLRIGIATAKGIAAALNCEIRGVCTLYAISKNIVSSKIPVMSILDAKKGEVFCALYSAEGHELVPPVNIEPRLLGNIISEPTLLIGNALGVYDDVFKKILGDNYVPGQKEAWFPRASIIGKLAADDSSSTENITPVYIRASDATLLLENKLKKINLLN